MAVSVLTDKRLTRDEFYKLCSADRFAGRKVELLDGKIIEMPPPSPEHSYSVNALSKFIRRTLGEDWYYMEEKPLSIDENELVPDFAVVQGSFEDFFHQNPTTAHIIVEVARVDSSKERGKKATAYAKANIGVYVIVDRKRETVDVMTQPSEGGYKHQETLHRGDVLHLFGADIPVKRVLEP